MDKKRIFKSTLIILSIIAVTSFVSVAYASDDINVSSNVSTAVIEKEGAVYKYYTKDGFDNNHRLYKETSSGTVALCEILNHMEKYAKGHNDICLELHCDIACENVTSPIGDIYSGRRLTIIGNGNSLLISGPGKINSPVLCWGDLTLDSIIFESNTDAFSGYDGSAAVCSWRGNISISNSTFGINDSHWWILGNINSKNVNQAGVVNINNCTFNRNNSMGAIGVKSSDCKITGCTFNNMTSRGITLYNEGKADISDCIFNNVGGVNPAVSVNNARGKSAVISDCCFDGLGALIKSAVYICHDDEESNDDTGTLTVNNCIINGTSNVGCGIFNTHGTVNVEGSTIIYETESGITNDGTVNISSADITGNKIGIINNNTLIHSGGNIHSNYGFKPIKSDNCDVGVYQNGTYFISDNACVYDNSIYLVSNDKYINQNSKKFDGSAVITTGIDDRQIGRELVKCVTDSGKDYIHYSLAYADAGSKEHASFVIDSVEEGSSDFSGNRVGIRSGNSIFEKLSTSYYLSGEYNINYIANAPLDALVSPDSILPTLFWWQEDTNALFKDNIYFDTSLNHIFMGYSKDMNDTLATDTENTVLNLTGNRDYYGVWEDVGEYDPQSLKVITNQVRCITRHAYNTFDESKGGCLDESVWYKDPDYISVMNSGFDNMDKNTPIASYVITSKDKKDISKYMHSVGLQHMYDKNILNHYVDNYLDSSKNINLSLFDNERERKELERLKTIRNDMNLKRAYL